MPVCVALSVLVCVKVGSPVCVELGVSVCVVVGVHVSVRLGVVVGVGLLDGAGVPVTVAVEGGMEEDGDMSGAMYTDPAPLVRPLAPIARKRPSPDGTTGRPNQSFAFESAAQSCEMSIHSEVIVAPAAREST